MRRISTAVAILTVCAASVGSRTARSEPDHGFKLDFAPAEKFRGTQVYRQAKNLAYAYVTTHAAADADGAPNAYHPADVGKNCSRDEHLGLDCPANAGYPHFSWWKDVLVADPKNPSKGYVQKDGAFKGYFVAMTSLRRSDGDKYDPSTYVDATEVPYVVIPSGFEKLPHVATQGDVGIATYLDTGKRSAFIVADSGGGQDAKLGEASIAFYAALGFPNANPRNGKGLPKGAIQYIIFPGSHRSGVARWPRKNDDIKDQAIALIAATPGIQQ